MNLAVDYKKLCPFALILVYCELYRTHYTQGWTDCVFCTVQIELHVCHQWPIRIAKEGETLNSSIVTTNFSADRHGRYTEVL